MNLHLFENDVKIIQPFSVRTVMQMDVLLVWFIVF